MATFSIHDEDGKITQSNTVFGAENYDKILREHGFNRFVRTEENSPLHHHLWHVKDGAPTQRRPMPIVVSKTTIKAGGNDTAIISGFPAGSTVTVRTGGIQIFKDMIQQTSLEIAIPVPCIYQVTVEKWPFRDFDCQIRAEV